MSESWVQEITEADSGLSCALLISRSIHISPSDGTTSLWNVKNKNIHIYLILRRWYELHFNHFRNPNE